MLSVKLLRISSTIYFSSNSIKLLFLILIISFILVNDLDTVILDHSSGDISLLFSKSFKLLLVLNF